MKTRTILLTFGFFLIVGLPRLVALDAHWASDESTWLYRSQGFMHLIQGGEFQQTLITHHPGVTTMWLGGIRRFFRDTPTWLSQKDLALARWFICVAITAGLCVTLYLLRHLFPPWCAAAVSGFLVSDPFFLAQTRKVHTDALATLFILLTVLLFLLYCIRDTQKSRQSRYLIFAGIAFGLACLSKSYSLILLLWMPLCLWLFRPQNTPWRKFLYNSWVTGIFFINWSLFTVFFLWPVFWHPLGICLGVSLLSSTLFLQRAVQSGKHFRRCVGMTLFILTLCTGYVVRTLWIVFEKVGWAVTTAHEIDHFFLGKIIADPGWLFYFFTISVKSSPFVLPLAVGGILFLWKHRHDENAAKHFKCAAAVGALVVLFTVCLVLTSKKFARYLLPTFLMLDILAGMGLFYASKWVGTQLKKHGFQNIAPAAGVILVLILTAAPIFILHPYYGTYYNPCWKVPDITNIITVNDTSGLELAAKYLNQKANAENLYVQASDLGSEFLRYYFRGTVYRADTDCIEGTGELRPADYEVVYIRDLQIGRVHKEGKRGGIFERAITLNGIDYVWIYRIPHKESR